MLRFLTTTQGALTCARDCRARSYLQRILDFSKPYLEWEIIEKFPKALFATLAEDTE